MGRDFHSELNGSPRRSWKSFLLILVTTISVCSAPQKTQPVGIPAPVTEISIIPKPASIVLTKGYFEFSRDTKIIADDADAGAVKASTSLNKLLMERYGFTLETTHDPGEQNSITFSTVNAKQDQAGADEGYSLKIKPGAIQIMGSERGMFYGIQSLLQLFPADFKGEANIAAADITDAPRFRYRGMHLDVARHFMPVEFVKKYIRLISNYKYNYFHWHLTDDQGWRIEIKGYPLLTSTGSKRPETVVGNKCFPFKGDNNPVGGFYTQAQIRDIVEYAKERYVTIIPEIEIPGHSSAALASYPALGCCGEDRLPYQVKKCWGAFPDIFCPTELTFQFLEDVLTDVISLFPDSPYIHIGGDEVKTVCWSNSKEVQDIKRANHLSSDAEVKSWFLNNVERFVNSKGKKIIGWDDMLDMGLPGLPPNATVMFWRSTPMAKQSSEMAKRNKILNGRPWGTAVQAAKAQHEVIMTPDDYTYFDHPQGNPNGELTKSFYDLQTPLKKVYDFEPVPAELNQEEAKYIIGAQGCIWTELLKKPKDVEYMVFPRALALAEVLWSKRENKDFAGFFKRLNKEFRNLDREHVYYRIP